MVNTALGAADGWMLIPFLASTSFRFSLRIHHHFLATDFHNRSFLSLGDVLILTAYPCCYSWCWRKTPPVWRSPSPLRLSISSRRLLSLRLSQNQIVVCPVLWELFEKKLQKFFFSSFSSVVNQLRKLVVFLLFTTWNRALFWFMGFFLKKSSKKFSLRPFPLSINLERLSISRPSTNQNPVCSDLWEFFWKIFKNFSSAHSLLSINPRREIVSLPFT